MEKIAGTRSLRGEKGTIKVEDPSVVFFYVALTCNHSVSHKNSDATRENRNKRCMLIQSGSTEICRFARIISSVLRLRNVNFRIDRFRQFGELVMLSEKTQIPRRNLLLKTIFSTFQSFYKFPIVLKPQVLRIDWKAIC